MMQTIGAVLSSPTARHILRTLRAARQRPDAYHERASAILAYPASHDADDVTAAAIIAVVCDAPAALDAALERLGVVDRDTVALRIHACARRIRERR